MPGGGNPKNGICVSNHPCARVRRERHHCKHASTGYVLAQLCLNVQYCYPNSCYRRHSELQWQSSNIRVQDLPNINSKVTKTLHLAYWPYVPSFCSLHLAPALTLGCDRGAHLHSYDEWRNDAVDGRFNNGRFRTCSRRYFTCPRARYQSDNYNRTLNRFSLTDIVHADRRQV